MPNTINPDAIRAGIKVLCQRLHKSDEFLHPAEIYTVHAAIFDIVNDILAAAKPFLTPPPKAGLKIIHRPAHAPQTDMPGYMDKAMPKFH